MSGKHTFEPECGPADHAPRRPAGPATRLTLGIRTRPGTRQTGGRPYPAGTAVSPIRTQPEVADRETA